MLASLGQGGMVGDQHCCIGLDGGGRINGHLVPVDRIFERMFLAGGLDTPGMGYIYVTPLLQAATYIPPHLIDA